MSELQAIEIKVLRCESGMWIWKLRRLRRAGPGNGGKFLAVSQMEFMDAWEANKSADRMSVTLKACGCGVVKVKYGQYDFSGVRKPRVVRSRSDVMQTAFGFGVVLEKSG